MASKEIHYYRGGSQYFVRMTKNASDLGTGTKRLAVYGAPGDCWYIALGATTAGNASHLRVYSGGIVYAVLDSGLDYFSFSSGTGGGTSGSGGSGGGYIPVNVKVSETKAYLNFDASTSDTRMNNVSGTNCYYAWSIGTGSSYTSIYNQYVSKSSTDYVGAHCSLPTPPVVGTIYNIQIQALQALSNSPPNVLADYKFTHLVNTFLA